MRKLFGFFSWLFPCWFPPKLDATCAPCSRPPRRGNLFFFRTVKGIMGDQLSCLTSIDTQSLNRHFMPPSFSVSKEKREKNSAFTFLDEGFFTVGWQAKAQHGPQRCWQWAECGGKGPVKCDCEGLCFLLFRPSFMSYLLDFLYIVPSLSPSLSLSLSSEPVLI